MNINKKAVVTTGAVLGVAALVAGGTIAYFTDYKTETNHFTVGDVNVTLYESQLHRENSGRMGIFPALASDPHYCDWTASSSVPTEAGNSSLINGSYDNARYCTPNLEDDIYRVAHAEGITAVANGHTAANRNYGFSDAAIVADADTYKAGAETETTDDDGYFTTVSEHIVPGQWVRKFSYVKNESQSSDAYIMIKYMVPAEYADSVELKIPGTPYEEDTDATKAGAQGYFTAVELDTTPSTNRYKAYELTNNGIDDYAGYDETIEGENYKVYAAVTRVALKPGEMTFWSPINNVRLKPTVTTADFDYGDAIDVKVEAHAIQARTFADGIEAINNL